jgi:hypothetical protein
VFVTVWRDCAIPMFVMTESLCCCGCAQLPLCSLTHMSGCSDDVVCTIALGRERQQNTCCVCMTVEDCRARFWEALPGFRGQP